MEMIRSLQASCFDTDTEKFNDQECNKGLRENNE